MKPEEYINQDATGLSELMQQGQVSRAAVMDAAITRAEQLNPGAPG